MATWHVVGQKTFGVNVQMPAPNIQWGVSVPKEVRAGEKFTVTVWAIPTDRPVPVSATINIFGKTYSQNGTAYRAGQKVELTFDLTAPSKPGYYTGTVTLSAYY